MASALTFGVEFEFALACWVSDDPVPDPDDGMPPILYVPNARNCDTLYHGAAAIINGVFHNAGFRTFLISEDNDVAQGYPSDGVLSRWVVDTDPSIQFPNELYDWVNIEINSPVMYFSPGSLRAVQLVCQLLTNKFRINVNSSCGLHVHVGNGTKSFDLCTIRNLMSFVYTFEPVLVAIHPPHRMDNHYAQSARHSSLVTRDLINEEKTRLGINDWDEGARDRPDPKVRVIDALTRIHGTETINELRNMVAVGTLYRMAVNLDNLMTPYDDAFKRTVEFRQHASTLNGDRVVAWIQLVVGLVQWSINVDAAPYTKFIIDSAEKQDVGDPPELPKVWELLRIIGLHEPAHFYEERLRVTDHETEENVLPRPCGITAEGMYIHPDANLEVVNPSSDDNISNASTLEEGEISEAGPAVDAKGKGTAAPSEHTSDSEESVRSESPPSFPNPPGDVDIDDPQVPAPWEAIEARYTPLSGPIPTPNAGNLWRDGVSERD